MRSEVDCDAPDRLDSYQLFQCKGCYQFFATEAIQRTKQCPYCGDGSLVGSMEDYDIVQQ